MPKEDNSNQSSPFEIVTTSKPKGVGSKSVVVIVIVLLLLGAFVFLGVYLVSQRQNVAEKAAPATTIYISPGSQSKAAGSNFTFSVNMDTSTNAVTGIDTRLKFDPNVVQVISLQQGSGVTALDQTISNTYDNSAGTISYAIFTLDSSKAVSGSGVEVLVVNATLKSTAAAGSSIISFEPATAASASQEGQNVLIGKTQGVVNVTSSTGATATPSPVSTATATPVPTSTSSSQATATPVPTSVGSSATATPMPIPETGTGWATYLGLGLGMIVIIASIALAI